MRSRRACLSGLALAAALALAGCAAKPAPVAMQQDMRMGPFTLRAVSVESYSRAHQGVPWQVDMTFELSGGNRFERADFSERLNRKRLIVRASGGWRERTWLLRRGDDVAVLAAQVTPPVGTHGYTLDLPNPYGDPAAYRLDLGI